jgi:hypothetical protein
MIVGVVSSVKPVSRSLDECKPSRGEWKREVEMVFECLSDRDSVLIEVILGSLYGARQRFGVHTYEKKPERPTQKGRDKWP